MPWSISTQRTEPLCPIYCDGVSQVAWCRFTAHTVNVKKAATSSSDTCCPQARLQACLAQHGEHAVCTTVKLQTDMAMEPGGCLYAKNKLVCVSCGIPGKRETPGPSSCFGVMKGKLCATDDGYGSTRTSALATFCLIRCVSSRPDSSCFMIVKPVPLCIRCKHSVFNVNSIQDCRVGEIQANTLE